MMSSSDVFCGPEGVRGYPETATGTEGPDKIPAVSKSISLQEMRQRPSLRDISECDVTGEGGNSSGVFSCSVDISDVCMADLTRLSDSTVCSSSESISRPSSKNATPHQMSSAVMSTPVAAHLLSISTSDVPTPIRSQSDFLSPQFGASDDYLRRNIKFIHKQLGSLMTQLMTEDKYFQTCSERYEEVIANLEDEIVALKSAKDNPTKDLPALGKTTQVESPGNIVAQQNEEGCKYAYSQQDTNSILQKIAYDFLPHLHSMVQSASANLPVAMDPWECDVSKGADFKNLTSVFDKCLTQLGKVVKAFNGGCNSLSGEFQDISSRMENTKLTDSGTESLSSFQEDLCSKKLISDLENKVCELEAANDSLRSECRLSQEKISQMESDQPGMTGKSQQSDEETAEKRSEQMLRFQLEQVTHSLDGTKCDLAKVQAELECKSLAYESMVSGTNSEKAEIERQVSLTSVELSKTKRRLIGLEQENMELKESLYSKEYEMTELEKKLKQLETEHKAVVEEFKIKGSALILENSKLAEKLEMMVREAEESAKRSVEKFSDLQKMYEALMGEMETKLDDFNELKSQKEALDSVLITKDVVLGRLCSNFNELLAIFRECQGLGLDQDSSATDIDDGFIRLKRRLLDLSQDYITLNNRNKLLEKEAITMTAKLKEKEQEAGIFKKKYETKCEKLQRTLENLEDENKVLVSQKIEQDDAVRKMKSKLRDLELQEAKGCQDCTVVRSQLQQLQIDLADKDAAISTLELHIQSCCEYNRKKAQQYKHELHAYKRQMDAHSSFAVDFGLSPKKSKSLNPRVDVGVQCGESFLHHHSGGFVERFKIRELEEKLIKLEKERTVLKRLCKVRSDRIHELESQVSSLPNSHGSK